RCNGKKRCHAVQKPTIAVEQCGSAAVLDKPLFVGEKHGHTRAIFGRVEDLSGLIRLWREGHLGGMQARQGSSWTMVTQNGCRMQKRLKRQKQVRLRAFASQPDDRAHSWQGNITQKNPLKVVELDVMTCIMHVHHHELVI